MSSAVGYDYEPEYSIFYQLYKSDDNETVWQSSSVFNLTRDDEDLVKFLVYGVVMSTVIIFGIIGNVLSIIVLTRPTLRSPIGCFLIGLAVADLGVTSLSIPLLTLPSILTYVSSYFGVEILVASISSAVLLPTIYALVSTAYTASIYFTMAIAVERYIAVCHPFRAKISALTYSKARWISVGITVFAIIFNSPRWFEYESMQIFDAKTNEFIGYRPVLTELRKNPIYDRYYVWASALIFLMWIPMMVLSFSNIQIYRAMRKAKTERQVLSPAHRHDDSVSRTLLALLTMSSVTNLVVIVEGLQRKLIGPTDRGLLEIECARNLVFELNSSVNFLIYSFMGRRFRQAFMEILKNYICCVFHIFRRKSDSEEFDIDEEGDCASQRTSSFSIILPQSSVRSHGRSGFWERY